MMPRLRHAPARRRRGSVFVLVIAVLATLVLLALSFSYSSRVELTASRNWANGVQSRFAVLGGIPQYNAPNDAQGGIVTAKSTNINTVRTSSRSSAEDAGLDTPLTREPKLAAFPLKLTPADPRAALTDLGYNFDAFSANNKAVGTLLAQNAQANAGGNTLELNNVSRDPATDLAGLTLSDPGARLNINALVPDSLVRKQNNDATTQRYQNSGTSANARAAATPPYLGEEVLARLIQSIMESRNLSGPNAQQLAHAIALRRFGTDGKPGRAGRDDEDDRASARETEARRLGQNATASAAALDRRMEPSATDRIDNNLDGRADDATDTTDDLAEALSDPRERPNGDDTPYGALSELMTIPGMTPALFMALTPYLTVFSVSYEAFELQHDAEEADGQTGMGWPRVDPNTASAETIYKTLRARFPKHDKDLLGQFTVNLLDRRDTDDVPTTVKIDGIEYTGIEITPYINEVCPDVPSFDEEGDNGQFLELYNPYRTAINITGWTLSGAGSSVMLEGTIPSEGYLVLTDDYNDENDPNANATGATSSKSNGSFYEIFRVAPAGPKRQLKEIQGFNLENEAGTVKLADPQGHVVDEFAWTGGKWTGAVTSFQRGDPRLRKANKQLATPLAANAGSALNDDTRRALQIQQDWQNQPFANALDVMLVSSAFVKSTTASSAPGATTSANASQGYSYSLPVLSAANDGQLDVRLVDCFQIGARLPDETDDRYMPRADVLPRQGVQETQTVANDTEYAATRPVCAARFGAINLNTAPLGVLAALPGMKDTLLQGIARRRAQALQIGQNAHVTVPTSRDATWWKDSDPIATGTWVNLSDFLLDETLWQDRPLFDRLDAVYAFLPLVSMGSQALVIDGDSRSPEGRQERVPSHMSGQRLLAYDRGVLETLAFRYAGQGAIELGDPDLRLGQPLSQVKPVFNEADILLKAVTQRSNAEAKK